MATYYYYEDAVGTSDGLSEANAYDGSSTVTLPDDSSGVCSFRNVYDALQSGDTLYVKKSSSAISLGGSFVNTTSPANPADHDDVAGYGSLNIIGYQTTIGDGKRAEIDMGGATWWLKNYVKLTNINLINMSYSGNSIVVNKASRFVNCGFYKTTGNGEILRILQHAYVDRCEFVYDYSVSGVNTDACVEIANSANVVITNCYFEAGNGANGIYVPTVGVSGHVIKNCIFNINLDKNGQGNNNGRGIYYLDVTYEHVSSVHSCIFHNCDDGIYVGVSDTRFGSTHIEGCIFSSCGSAIDGDDFFTWPGFSGDTDTHYDENQTLFSSNNFYYANTSNSYLPSEANPTYLTTDPFVDAANKDFTLKNPDDFGYAKNFLQSGASGDTITRNALVNIAPFSVTTSGELNLGTGDVGDVVDVSGNSFQLTQINPRVWRNV